MLVNLCNHKHCLLWCNDFEIGPSESYACRMWATKNAHIGISCLYKSISMENWRFVCFPFPGNKLYYRSVWECLERPADIKGKINYGNIQVFPLWIFGKKEKKKKNKQTLKKCFKLFKKHFISVDTRISAVISAMLDFLTPTSYRVLRDDFVRQNDSAVVDRATPMQNQVCSSFFIICSFQSFFWVNCVFVAEISCLGCRDSKISINGFWKGNSFTPCHWNNPFFVTIFVEMLRVSRWKNQGDSHSL